MSRGSDLGVRGSVSTATRNSVGGAEDLTRRVRDTKHSGFTRVWKSIKDFVVVSVFREPKFESKFLKQAWQVGADRSNVKMLQALISEGKVNCSNLTDSQKSHLRQNLMNHGEVLAAIQATISEIESSGERNSKFCDYLVELRTSLHEVYAAVGCKFSHLRGNERRCDELRNVLKGGWARGDKAGTPAERIHQQLVNIRRNPDQYARPLLSFGAQTIADYRSRLARNEFIERSDAEDLIRWAMRGGDHSPKFSLQTYVDLLMRSPIESQDQFLKLLMHAVEVDRGWGVLTPANYINEALHLLEEPIPVQEHHPIKSQQERRYTWGLSASDGPRNPEDAPVEAPGDGASTQTLSIPFLDGYNIQNCKAANRVRQDIELELSGIHPAQRHQVLMDALTESKTSPDGAENFYLATDENGTDECLAFSLALRQYAGWPITPPGTAQSPADF